MPAWDSLSNHAAVVWFILGFVSGVAVTVAIWLVLRKLIPRLGLQVSTLPGDGIDIDGAVAMLHGQSGFRRVESIREMCLKLPGDLSGQDASRLLHGLSGFNRVNALSILKPKLRKSLSDADVELILHGLTGSNRTNAIKILSQ